MVHATRILLRQSRERMIITRVAHDISAYDTSRYSLNIATSSSSPTPRFYVGQPIRVSWTAPSNHSRKDSSGSTASARASPSSHANLVRREVDAALRGRMERQSRGPARAGEGDSGETVFRGDQLPWQPGQYELRYQHDGKHNVMSRLAPIEIYVGKPENDSVKAVHQALFNIACLSLDEDPSLLPRSAKKKARQQGVAGGSGSSVPSGVASRNDVALPAIADREDGVCAGRGRTWASSTTPTSTPRPRPSSTQSKTASSPCESLPPRTSHPAHEAKPLPRILRKSKSRSAPPPSADWLALATQTALGDRLAPSSASVSFADGDPHPAADPTAPDADDFVIMTESQAKRNASLAEMAFGVEVSADVVVTEANLGALARGSWVREGWWGRRWRKWQVGGMGRGGRGGRPIGAGVDVKSKG
ncbi:hypothetical protein IAT38_005842 [Cryptococcus sp. DSM 104549]